MIIAWCNSLSPSLLYVPFPPPPPSLRPGPFCCRLRHLARCGSPRYPCLPAPSSGATHCVRCPSACRSSQRRQRPSANAPGRLQAGQQEPSAADQDARPTVEVWTASQRRPAAATPTAAVPASTSWAAATADDPSRAAARCGTPEPAGGWRCWWRTFVGSLLLLL